MSLRLPLDFDAPVTGIYMENLIDLWCSKGLTTDQADVLVKTSDPSYQLDDGFIKCLGKPLDDFEFISNRIMGTLEDWEEIPAWDELYRLNWNLTVDAPSETGRDPIVFDHTPTWYREEFKKYLERQAERDKCRHIHQETWLRVNAMTDHHLIERRRFPAGSGGVAKLYDGFASMLEKPTNIPHGWWLAIEKSMASSLLPPDFTERARAEQSRPAWMPPDFMERARAEQSRPAWMPPDFIEQSRPAWMPPDFIERARAAWMPPYFTKRATSPWGRDRPKFSFSRRIEFGVNSGGDLVHEHSASDLERPSKGRALRAAAALSSEESRRSSVASDTFHAVRERPQWTGGN
ncbi:hypothetical protein ACJZ2D_017073 [Fusarium nematophilum]